MPEFSKHDLDRIRGALKVSDVVSKRFKLRRSGEEFVDADNPSFTVSDRKRLYKEFGDGGLEKGGDIFDFLVNYEGFTFPDAVRELARQAGISIEPGRSDVSSGHGTRARDNPPAQRADRSSDDGYQQTEARGKREVVKEWDYRDPEGTLLYQTVRIQERMPDGSFRENPKKPGKAWKSFLHRRPAPDGSGWIWGMDTIDREGVPIEFMRKDATRDWSRYDSVKFINWKYTERRIFKDSRNVEPWLYNANAIIDELAEPQDDQRTIFVPEGEGKVDVLTEWDLLAVAASGGANFTAEMAEFFRNAGDVVLLQDNDRAGAERVAKIAPMLVAVNARVRSLNFRDVWPKCPVKGDVTDWRDQGGGTRAGLLEIVDTLKPWKPEPFRSQFGAKTAYDLSAPVRAYPWRIKGIVPLNDDVLIMGPSRSGKTFEALDMLMHTHSGDDFAGRKVVPCGSVYLTYEGASGFENRLRAYLAHHNINAADLHSFAWITRPPNLFANEENIEKLAQEILKIAETFQNPLGVIVVDTHNAATRGSSEIKSEDMNKIMGNYATLREKAGAPLWVIGHTNAEGRHRGNEQFFNGIETALLVERVLEDAKRGIEKRDDDSRVVRRVRTSKQREGADDISWTFVLRPVDLGVDADGDKITSMVSTEPAQKVPDDVAKPTKERPEGFYLNETFAELFKVMLKALDKHGVVPPAELELPSSVTRVVRWTDVGTEYRKMILPREGEAPAKYEGRIHQVGVRFRKQLGLANAVITRAAVDPETEKQAHFVWPTGRRVFGRGIQWPAQPKKKDQPAPLLAPGEKIDPVF